MSADTASNRKSQNQLERGLAFFHRNEYAKAAELLQEAVLEQPDSYEALYNLACCFSMMDDKDKALSYLVRAANISPTCADWAKEDREFDSLRDDSLFQQIISKRGTDISEEITAPPLEEPELSAEADVELDSLGAEVKPEGFSDFSNLADEQWYEEEVEEVKAPPLQKLFKSQKTDKPAAAAQQNQNALPPCAKCGGIVEVERKMVFDPLLTISLLGGGIALSFLTVLTIFGLFGFPLIIASLYMLIQLEDIWTCQACKAQGKECGQPRTSGKL